MSAAAEARALVAGQTAGMLATSSTGHPWASLVAYAVLDDGSPVLVLSELAEHGRNLLAEPHASLVVADLSASDDPLACPRVTLAGQARQPPAADADRAREAFLAKVPNASMYADFEDFRLWVLRVERVRWVGGYGKVESIDVSAYRSG
jgi:heme iron utilization protein